MLISFSLRPDDDAVVLVGKRPGRTAPTIVTAVNVVCACECIQSECKISTCNMCCSAPLVRVKVKFPVKTPYADTEDSLHMVFVTVIFPVARTTGAALLGEL